MKYHVRAPLPSFIMRSCPNAVSKFTTEQTLKPLLSDISSNSDSSCTRELDLSKKVQCMCIISLVNQTAPIIRVAKLYSPSSRTSPSSTSQSTWCSSPPSIWVAITSGVSPRRWVGWSVSAPWRWTAISWRNYPMRWDNWPAWSLSLYVITVSLSWIVFRSLSLAFHKAVSGLRQCCFSMVSRAF